MNFKPISKTQQETPNNGSNSNSIFPKSDNSKLTTNGTFNIDDMNLEDQEMDTENE